MVRLPLLDEVVAHTIRGEVERVIESAAKNLCRTALRNDMSIEHVKASLARVMMKAMEDIDPVQIVQAAAREAEREHLASLAKK